MACHGIDFACKIDTPLLAAGSFIKRNFWINLIYPKWYLAVIATDMNRNFSFTINRLSIARPSQPKKYQLDRDEMTFDVGLLRKAYVTNANPSWQHHK